MNAEFNIDDGDDYDDSKHTFKNDDKNPHDPTVVLAIRCAYIVGILLWFLLLYFLKLYDSDAFGLCILAIVPILFLIAYANAPYVNSELESILFQSSYLTFAIILVAPVLTLLNKEEQLRELDGQVTRDITKVLVITIIIVMLSIIDVWVAPRWLPLVKHIQSILETAGVILMVYALYSYFIVAHI
jgi:hypothetical protein